MPGGGLSSSALMRWTGTGKIVSFYRYFLLNLPRTTTASGVALVLGVGAVHLYLLVTDQALGGGFDAPAYLRAYCAALLGAAVLSAVGMVAAPKAGWALGSLVAVAAIAVYVSSRVWGLPDLPALEGHWGYALGTFTLLLAGALLGLHFTVSTGLNVAWPQRRNWHD
ncbi:hypothetical protein [Actinomadura sediminis]|uniref:Oxidoreductase n=1 Tax=Actinomadura sediminis TaxID=1038904 RepID=A0ABW3EHY3_9ACTN